MNGKASFDSNGGTGTNQSHNNSTTPAEDATREMGVSDNTYTTRKVT